MTRVSDQGLRRLAWGAWWCLLPAVTIFSGLVSSLADDTGSWGNGLLGEAAFLLVVITFPLVGLVILLRQPRNRVGWLLQGVGVAWAAPGLLDAYATYGLVVAPGSLPGAGVAAALNEGTWTFGIVAMGVYLVLLFPDGRLPSPRWRWLAWVAGVAATVVPVAIAFSPGELEEAPIEGMVNPLGAEGPLAVVISVLLSVTLPLLPLTIIAAAVSLVLRFRRSRGLERQQVKWLAAAGALVALLYALTLASTLVAEVVSPHGRLPVAVDLLQQSSLLTFALLPLAIGAAVLRHRLFDIDLVINRALVYGTLTAALAGLYLGSVLLLQLLLRPLTTDSDLAVAASTLAVAALFGPARRRIQDVVDRRFYRRRYDAARTLEEFGLRLSRELDLDEIGHTLLRTVRDTVHPTEVGLWLRPAAEEGVAPGRSRAPLG